MIHPTAAARRLALLLVLAGMPAQAQQDVLPTLHDVTGVAANDSLNIRAEPGASAPILGTLPPDATGIEVTALDTTGRWGRIGAGETDGWVSMAYLAQRPFPPGPIPEGMRCFGTEPFWSLRFEGSAVFVDRMGETRSEMQVVAAPSPLPPGNRLFGFAAGEGAVRLSGIIEAAACSDGMSDRSFGWRVVLLEQDEGTMRVQSGCCTLDRR
ncbi:SH3 domain-containing protein [Tropicimonas sp. IMCC6043]|uniref:SH3 domain-containing protein n=1 Tax=Tropicimonas sp. IMCC6043 TaxID=2510645 RepID=UPI00101C44EC|nr:SH3 domain-containing protein [Tropicimonas sp. IMCC6043]RYH09922.1 peptide-binding protein [Tropicimonas sp. IMCC6043]